MSTSKIFETGAMQLEAGKSGTLATFTFQAEADDDIATTSAQTAVTGDAVYVVDGGSGLPTGLAALTLYYLIVIDTTHVKFATSYAHAVNNVAINLTTDGGAANVCNITGVASTGWGDASSAAAMGANDAFPWLAFDNKVNIGVTEDESVMTKGFKALPRMTGKTIDNALSFHGRYNHLNRFHYWMFGFEHDPVRVFVFRNSSNTGFDATPTPGHVYVHDGHNYTYLRTETYRSGMTTAYNYIFANAADTPLASGTATHDAITFTFTSVSSAMYEHTYELDSGYRHFRNYTSTEAAALASTEVTDKRNLMCTFGKRFDTYDIRYQNALCKAFTYKSAAPGLSTWETSFLAYTEARGDYSSSAWTLLSGLRDAQLIPAHHEHRFDIGTVYAIGTQGQLSGLSELGMTNVDISIEIPYQSVQDYVSGLSIAEPVMENFYTIKQSGTISRASVQTYQTYRDAQTPIITRLASNQGYYMQEFLVKTAVLSESGPTSDGVAQEVLAINPGYVEGSHQWSTWMQGITEIHGSPILFRTRDAVSANQMTAQ